MPDFSQSNRLISFSCSGVGADDLLPEHLKGSEGISELYRYELDLLAKSSTTIDPKKIVGQRACITLQAGATGGAKRFINGYVMGFEACGGDDEFNQYRAHIVPNIWLLGINRNTRVFQDKTVVEVVEEVLKVYNITLHDATSKAYDKLDYCTQYRETDLHFVSRLLEQFGILYYFGHSEKDHGFIIQDDHTKLHPCDIKSKFRYAPQGDDTEGFYDFVISEFRSLNTLSTSVFDSWDHSFVGHNAPKNSVTLETSLGTNGNADYDYIDSAAAYKKKEPDKVSQINSMNSKLNDVRSASINARHSWRVEGSSNAVCLASGFTIEIEKYPVSDLNTKYLVTHIEHKVDQVPSYRTKPSSEAEAYSNTFDAVPYSQRYLPPMINEKPRIHGMHTGKVVVPHGEDSHMDKWGRVCVQFWWDRNREPDTVDNTMLRVAQQWAGKNWGTYYWPRVNDEVLISFIEGDPDQPIVVGSLYNGVNMPRYDPAGQYTLSGVLTNSSKNGGEKNANELRFEDLQGKEQVFINAERDYDLHVENDWHALIGNDQHTKVGKDRIEEVDGDGHLQVKGKQVVKIVGDSEQEVVANVKEKVGQNSNLNVGLNLNQKVGETHSLDVGMNQYSKIGLNYVADAGMNVYIKGGMNVVVEGGMNVCLKGPGGFVSVGPQGVTIQGVMVMINSGGAAIPGSPGSPESPQAPGAPKEPEFPGDDPPSQRKS